MKITNNALTASDGGIPIAWDVSDNVTVTGDLRINGNDIQASDGVATLTMTGRDLALAGDLRINGNDIAASDGLATLTMTGRDLAVAGDLTVTGNDIKGSGGTVVTFSGVNTSLAGDLVVVGGDIDVGGAGPLNIGATVGANNMSLGASTSTVIVPVIYCPRNNYHC